jgi:hypothetical protein
MHKFLIIISSLKKFFFLPTAKQPQDFKKTKLTGYLFLNNADNVSSGMI